VKTSRSAAVIAALIGATMANPASSAPSGTLAYATEVLPVTWSPHAVVSNEWNHLLYETLVRRDPQDPSKLSPLLAESWEQTDTSLTLHLRNDAIFHDGAKFDAHAVKLNVDKILKEGWPASGTIGSISKTEVVDDYTVRFALSTPNPFLLNAFAGYYIGMGSPKAIESGTIGKTPVGTGPYKMNERETVLGGKVVLNAFPQYRDLDTLHFERIEVSPISDPAARVIGVRTGQFALAKLEPSALPLVKRFPDLNWISWQAYHVMIIFFDRTGAFSDSRLRRAICSALNTEGNATLLGADVATSTGQRFQKGAFGYAADAKPIPYDPAEARRLLAELGAKDLTITLPIFPTLSTLAQAMTRQLAEVGVTLRVEQMSLAQYLPVWRSGRYPVGIGQLGSADNPYAFYSTLIAKNAPFNPFKGETPEADEVVRKALQFTDLKQAEPLWARISKIAAEEPIECGDLELSSHLVYDPKKIKNVKGYSGFSATPLWRSIEPASN
jgi:peptide/nickel transport system substrate-binding protein